MSQPTALVLGATGRVGRPLCQGLVESGWRVHAAARCRDEDAVAQFGRWGLDPIRFDVTRDDPRGLPDVDVLLLEIWDPARPDLIWPVNFYGVGRVVERYGGIADITNEALVDDGCLDAYLFEGRGYVWEATTLLKLVLRRRQSAPGASFHRLRDLRIDTPGLAIQADGPRARLVVPRGRPGKTLHVILEVWDDGTPSLVSYRRVVLVLQGARGP